MESHEAREILRNNKVDISFDPRDPRDIVIFLQELGHLDTFVTVEDVAVDVNPVIMENR